MTKINCILVIVSAILYFCFYAVTCGPYNKCIVGSKPAKNYIFFVFVLCSLCGGTIVAHDAIVTAARCLYYSERHRRATNKEVHVLDADFMKPDWY